VGGHEDAGHFPFYNQPDAFETVVAEFLGELE
jgi:pimeloyl-ACP methyl ester carboxylesterase